ncbi:hypothetical protein [Bradyrhizobium sp. dw_78]|uniref:hypothetical protein n=1 Tax=Bradyrhizobium sp. dw_78 TaxID=2719793 RepID=UPI001BD4DDCF|nr:hypothetical protein [Bradyrhizobium sp. dw_78]
MIPTKSAVAVANNRHHTAWWRRALRSLGAVTGLFAAVGAGTSAAVAQDVGYRSAATAPAAWQAFAKQLQGRFEQRLAADDKDARSFQQYIAKRGTESNAPPLTFVARTWVLPDGKVERLEFDGLDDDQIAVHLRALLTRDNVGTPPTDMLQPLRLRLALRPKEQPAGGK